MAAAMGSNWNNGLPGIGYWGSAPPGTDVPLGILSISIPVAT